MSIYLPTVYHLQRSRLPSNMLYIRQYICPYACMSVTVRLSICPSVSVSVCLSVRPSVGSLCASVRLSVCLYVPQFLSACLCLRIIMATYYSSKNILEQICETSRSESQSRGTASRASCPLSPIGTSRPSRLGLFRGV